MFRGTWTLFFMQLLCSTTQAVTIPQAFSGRKSRVPPERSMHRNLILRIPNARSMGGPGFSVGIIVCLLMGLLGFKTGVSKWFFNGYALSTTRQPLLMLPFSNIWHKTEFENTNASWDDPGHFATKFKNFKLELKTAITFIEWKFFLLTNKYSWVEGAWIGICFPSIITFGKLHTCTSIWAKSSIVLFIYLSVEGNLT